METIQNDEQMKKNPQGTIGHKRGSREKFETMHECCLYILIIEFNYDHRNIGEIIKDDKENKH